MCLFIAFAVLDQPETFQALLDLLNAFYGLNLTGDDVVALGKRILAMERDFNMRGGFTKEQVIATLGIPEKDVTLIFVNGRHAELMTELTDGDTLSLFPPIGGG